MNMWDLRRLLQLYIVSSCLFIAAIHWSNMELNITGCKKNVASDSYPARPAAIQGVKNDSVSITDYFQPLESLADLYQNRSADSNLCLRKCDGVPRLCYYEFQVVYHTTMSSACGRCPSVKEDCYLPQCVAADGVTGGITTFNRMIPGPSIQVCEGDTVVVDVVNKLLAESTTVHWHGIRQMGTQYYDGVPYVTQCPIGPGQTFRYHFRPQEAGTFFYHSHSGLQKGDGLSGPLIVRENPNKKFNFYFDEDLPEHVVFIADWYPSHFVDRYPETSPKSKLNRPPSYLINGRGIFIGTKKTLNKMAAHVGRNDQPPVKTFFVEQGKIYRFRMINGGSIACPVTVFIQGHKLTIVSGEGGQDVVPTIVDTITFSSGEKFDFLINATQPVGSYWIAVEGLRDCTGGKQLGILSYKGAPPVPAARCKITAPGPLIFNPAISYCNGSRPKEICLFQLKAFQPPPKELTMPKGDMRLLLVHGDYSYTIQEMYQSGTYDPYFNVPLRGYIFRSMINNISYVAPPSPLISQYNDIPEDSFCQPQCNSPTSCICTHVVKIPLGTVVDVVIADSVPMSTVPPPHPFHLHGYNFYILEQGIFNSDPVAGLQEVFRRIDNGEVKNPTAPMKDIVMASSGGYVIIRFVADNPGFWLMHCHFLLHLETGMAIVFHVGEFSDLPPVPQGFPRCGNFLPKGIVLPEPEAGLQQNFQPKGPGVLFRGAPPLDEPLPPQLLSLIQRKRGHHV